MDYSPPLNGCLKSALLKELWQPCQYLAASYIPRRKVDAHISVLLEGTFLDRFENVLAFGLPGSGKTHLLWAIAQELIFQGRRVLFLRCDLLV